jgi:tRNA (guanine-N7-)-methyltransferase
MTEHDEMTVGEEQTEDGKFMRRIRSFVRREGRLTRGQDRALQELWPVMVLFLLQQRPVIAPMVVRK